MSAAAAAVDALPGGRAWREAIEAYPATERHLVIHAGHLIKANPRDEPHVADLIAFASSMALTGTVEQVSEKIAGLAALGVHRAGVPAGRIRHWARAPRLRVCRWPSARLVIANANTWRSSDSASTPSTVALVASSHARPSSTTDY
jgi:hypothetical protein